MAEKKGLMNMISDIMGDLEMGNPDIYDSGDLPLEEK